MRTAGLTSPFFVWPARATAPAFPDPVAPALSDRVEPGDQALAAFPGRVEQPADPPLPNPWPALASAGALVNGPVGVALQGQLRQDLLAALRRLEQGGARFHERHDRFILAPTFPQVPAERALALLEGKPDRLSLSRSGEEPKPTTLREMKLLDAELGAGPQIFTGQERELFDAARGMQEAGWELSRYHQATPPAQAVDLLARGAEVRFVRGDTLVLAQSWQELAAVEFFHGTGQALSSLERPEEAALLRAAERSGLGFLADSKPVSAYSAHIEPPSLLGARLGEGVAVALQPGELGDLEGLTRRLRELDSISQRVLEPAFQKHGKPPLYFPFVEGSSPELAAGVTAELARAAGSPGQITGMVERLARGATGDYDLACRTVAVARVLELAGEGQARACLDQMERLERTRLLSPAQSQEMEALYPRILAATGSFSGSLQAFDLIRLPVAGESQEDRLASFLRLVASRPTRRAAEAVDLYRAVLAERFSPEGLAPTEARLRSLLASVPPDQPADLALEAFRFLQSGLREGLYEPARADEMAAAFSCEIVLHGDAERAMRALQALPGSTSLVQEREDSVIVGGVRIRRSRAVPK